GRLSDDTALHNALQEWPRNVELVLSWVGQLHQREQHQEASEALRSRLVWFVPKASELQRARAFTLLAQSEAALANVSGAINYAERALVEDAGHKPARKLVAKLKAAR
ncbi:MAG: hypothetical protein AAFQ82_18350, partial [Myxococcota bacterium]